MRLDDIQRMSHDILDKCAVENDYIEYKKSFGSFLWNNSCFSKILCYNNSMATIWQQFIM